MGRDWKPGDVALMPDGKRAVVDGQGNFAFGAGEYDYATPRSISANAAHPLLVIDPEDREQVDRLRSATRADGLNCWSDVANWQQALRSLLEPPKPRCVAHGTEECPDCSRINSRHLTPEGGCHHCGTYASTGMHWDTCPGRLDAVYSTRADALIAEGIQP